MLCYIWIYYFVLKDRLNETYEDMNCSLQFINALNLETQTQKLLHKNVYSILFIKLYQIKSDSADH